MSEKIEIEMYGSYPREILEKYADENEYTVEDIGDNNIGQNLMILHHHWKDKIMSFLLDGCTGAGVYSYTCVYSDVPIRSRLISPTQF